MTSLSLNSPNGTTLASFGLPSVSVPVLSTTMVSTFSMHSKTSADLIKIPIVAPRPTPTDMATGVASPKAQGQAMINTATALTIAKTSEGEGPSKAQSTNAITDTNTTAGTNQEATLSARF